MTDTTQVADSPDARQASMSRVVTQETILSSMATDKAAQEPSDKTSEPAKPDEAEKPKKQTPQERIHELASKRREAEANAAAEKRRADELEARLMALEAGKAAPIEQANKPVRESYASDDEFIEALGDWKADQAIIRREQQQQEARLKAESEAIDTAFAARVDKTVKDIPDFAEVVGAANVQIPDFLVMAIKESEQGPLLTYYLAQHQEEARKIAAMRPVQALKQLMQIEAGLVADAGPESSVSQPKTKRAPEPITPVKGTTTPNPAPAKDFAEYRARRKAEQKR